MGTSITGACPTLARSEATVPVRTFCWKIIDHKTLSLPALEALIMPRRNEGVLSARVCNRNFDVYCEQSGKYDCCVGWDLSNVSFAVLVLLIRHNCSGLYLMY